MAFHAAPPPPFLLPQNRKLRHLRGIFLRNLTFPQHRKHSIDDSAVGVGGASTADREKKRASLRKALHHARSSDDLRTDKAGAARGRSATLSGATALARQHILEEALDSSTADAFFSLHSEGLDAPLYVSEVGERATNFNFRFFDLTADLDPLLCRASQLTVKIWVRRAAHTNSSSLSSWTLLVEDDVDLRFLGFIGSLQGIRFPPNTLVFHLLDGVYMVGVPLTRLDTRAGGARSTKHSGPPPLPTSSYNALMRLANLENSLQDCLATQAKLARQIEALAEDEADDDPAALLPEADAQRRRALKALARRRRLAETARQKRADLTASLQARRAAIAAGRALQQRAWADVEHATDKLAASRATAARTLDDIRGQRRRICEDLIRIFAMAPVPGVDEPLAFQICGMPLPNTAYGPALAAAAARGSPGTGEDILSAALGFVAVLVNALQTYLGVALPYRVTAYGSRSVVRDDISKTIPDAQREFPLYVPRGGLGAQYRFDYAWFLLNKDIETLCYAQGLKVVDIRHTLPNLQYLLYVCSAGTEELPERKKGGVRGLWMGHLQRRGSADVSPPPPPPPSKRASRSLAMGDGRERGEEAGRNGRAVVAGGPLPASSTAPSSVASSPASTLHLPFDEGTTTWTLRTKGMRERV